MTTVLRPARRSGLISARVFDDQFARALRPEIDVRPVPLQPWLDVILGSGSQPQPLMESAAGFAAATAGHAFLCPDSTAIPLAPLLVALRNLARAPVRLLLVAHAPGAYALEWALLRPLLADGDRIVAPTRSARDVLHLLCPELDRFVRVVPHPMAPLPPAGASGRPALVSLGRLHRTKLLHRQIEAIALLTRRGLTPPRLLIAGPLAEPGGRNISGYALGLRAKINRLGLHDHVNLLGTIEGPAAKARLLAGNAALLNLSVSIEESFGKSLVEALGAGVPAVCTRWGPFSEIVGATGGDRVEVHATPYGVDVDPATVAEAILSVLSDPPSRDACRTRAEAFHPDRIRPRYRDMLDEARAEPSLPSTAGDDLPAVTAEAAPTAGLLAGCAPLTQLGWRELFGFHLDDVDHLRRDMLTEDVDAPTSDPAPADQLRALLLHGVRAPLERFLGGLPMQGLDEPVGSDRQPEIRPAGDLWRRLDAAAASPGLRIARLACLDLLARAGDTASLSRGLLALVADGVSGPGVDYLRVEEARQAGDLRQAFQLCVAPEDEARWGEDAAPQLQQLARVSRECGLPGLALPWLRDWLEAFPDGPDAGIVWYERYLNTGDTPALADEARAAHQQAARLLGRALPAESRAELFA